MLPKFTTPKSIQDYLDALAYNTTERTLCPRDVVREGMAHCMDGAVFAASAPETIGHLPLLVDLRAVDIEKGIRVAGGGQAAEPALLWYKCTAIRIHGCWLLFVAGGAVSQLTPYRLEPALLCLHSVCCA
jgi:hypothetical protein